MTRSQVAASRKNWQAKAPAAHLKKRCIKRPWEKVREPQSFGFAFEIGHYDIDIAAEFPEKLAACAAGRGQLIGIGDNRNPAEAASPGGYAFKDGVALGADGQAVGSVLHVAASVNVAIQIFDGRAHQEL